MRIVYLECKEVKRMPTFNQLEERVDRLLKRSQQLLLLVRDLTLFTRSQSRLLLHRREVFVLLLRQLHLKSLTQLFVRSPEYVFQTESKLLATFQEKATTFRNTQLFLSVVVE